MGKLTKIANNILGAGGEYIPLNDLIADYPDGVTINGAFIRKTDKGDKPCFTFSENANKYFYAVSGDLANLFEGWLHNCNGDVSELNEELHVENIVLKIQKKRTKSGNTYTKAWVVGTVEKQFVEDEQIDEETGEIINSTPF